MRGASRASLLAARERLETVTRDPAVDLARVGDELFGVLELLDREPRLRRTLSDPARAREARAGLVRVLLESRVSAAALDLMETIARGRWSSPGDLTDAVEMIAVEAVVAAAERDGRLDDVEDELFRFVRIVDATPALRQALSDRAAPAESKRELVRSLLGDRAASATTRLVTQAALAPRGRTMEKILHDYGQVAAARRDRLVASVRVAAPLAADQRDRLAAALRRIYGHEVHLDIDVDPDVLGGGQVTIAGESADGTIASRLHEARRRLAG
jgi:F-type H+-transporting ATPase subunit delta